MPKTIDQDALESPSLKVMDIGNPPTKSIAFEEFPKVVYLHPKDKTKQHLAKLVGSHDEQEAALSAGYKLVQHIPVEPVVDLSEEFEADTAPEKRGPGRPKAA